MWCKCREIENIRIQNERLSCGRCGEELFPEEANSVLTEIANGRYKLNGDKEIVLLGSNTAKAASLPEGATLHLFLCRVGAGG